MNAFRLVLVVVLVLAAATARAQEVSTAIVPAVGNVFGVSMARWLTDVEIANESSFDIDVAIELPAADAAPLFFTLSPGQAQRFTDIVAQAFGLDHALSPLRVTSSSRRGVRVRAQAYAVSNGQLSPPQRIEVYGSDTYFPVRVLDGLQFSEDYRTNIGIVNVGEQPADFLLALQRIPGRNVAITHIRVGAGGVVHSAIQALFPLITSGSGFSIVVETSSRDTHLYASVIESKTNVAKFIVPRIGAR